MSKPNQEAWVGKSVPRKEGRGKVTGSARYVDDLDFPGALHGVTVRSTIARGHIKAIHFEPGVPWDEFTVVTHKDIPGKNNVTLIELDQPFLAETQVHHPHEPILLLAHPDKGMAEEGRKRVRIEYEPGTAVLDFEKAEQVFKTYLIEKGNVDSVWKTADLIVEGEYFTGAQEQLYIEPNGVVAVASPQEGVTVWGSLQCPYYVHKGLKPLFGLPAEKVRIVQVETGGGFGGKEEYPTLIAGHAALLAWKSGKPVKLIYDRAEDMAATTKRHPSRTRHRTAVTKDGKLVGMEIDFLLDGGAYATLSAVVLSRGTIHSAGPYKCDHVRVKSRAVLTHTPPHGAFRGFGAPQSLFALERHMDRVAAAVGLSPYEFRRRNLLKKGDSTATSQVIREEVDFEGLFKKAFQMSDYHKKRERFQRENPTSRIKRGMGFASFLHGAGFTGSGERFLSSVVGVEATPEGKIRVLAASTEIGQGTNTIFSQITADALGLHYDDIEIAQPDTAQVPDSGPTVASRTCMIVGKLVENAAHSLREALIQSGYFRLYERGISESLPRLHREARAPQSFQPVQATARRGMGRQSLPGRGVRGLCVGGLCRRGNGRHGHL
jgi:CO/xanthine dehydrogenase Mo-binding subunit